MTQATRQADPQLIQFFNACYTDDIDTVQMLLHLTRQMDPRDTNPELNIYKNFYGIHYACLGRALRVLNELLPSCYEQTTQSRIVMHFPYVSTTSNMILNEDSDLLELCCISNFTEGVEPIVKLLEKKTKKYSHRNVCGETCLHFAAINNNECSKVLIRSEYLLNLWDAETYGKHLNFLSYSAELGRFQIFECLTELFDLDSSAFVNSEDEKSDKKKSAKEVTNPFRDSIITLMLQTDDSFGNLEKMSYSVLQSYEKMGTTKEEKAKTALACNFLCKKVIKYCLLDENEKKYRRLVKTFDKKCEELGQKSQVEFLRKQSKLELVKEASRKESLLNSSIERENAQSAENSNKINSQEQIKEALPTSSASPLQEECIEEEKKEGSDSDAKKKHNSTFFFKKRQETGEQAIKESIAKGNKAGGEITGSDPAEEAKDAKKDKKKKAASAKEENPPKRDYIPDIEDEFGLI